MAAARTRIAELEAELARVSARDPLVASLLTLPALRAQMALDVQRARRYGRPLAVAALDIDDFRHLNMKHGYGAGDMLLASVGALLSAATRAHDLVCRAGGDEFIMLLPETSADEAGAVLERVLEDITELEAAGESGFTASAGVAALGREQTAESVVGRAQDTLALARAEGGGRVRVSRGDGSADEESDSASGAMIAALAQALEERDSFPGAHSESVVDLTGIVAEALGLGHDEVRTIRSAALLHDIGKVGIPDEILLKPGELNEREREVVHQHPVTGERILKAIPGMAPVARIVRHEHERWDGDGYPDGLAGTAIPVGARIIFACDSFHAMRSDRPFRNALSHHDALAELSRNAGSQFDPGVVETLVGHLFRAQRGGLTAV